MTSITPVYAALAAFIFVTLSVRTLRYRRKLQIAIGDGGDAVMLRAMRVHANFAEYAPFALLLIWMFEVDGAPALVVHGLCVSLLLGRVLHAWGVRQTDERYAYRVTGMALTFTAIGLAAFGILLGAIIPSA